MITSATCRSVSLDFTIDTAAPLAFAAVSRHCLIEGPRAKSWNFCSADLTLIICDTKFFGSCLCFSLHFEVKNKQQSQISVSSLKAVLVHSTFAFRAIIFVFQNVFVAFGSDASF